MSGLGLQMFHGPLRGKIPFTFLSFPLYGEKLECEAKGGNQPTTHRPSGLLWGGISDAESSAFPQAGSARGTNGLAGS